ncbi:GMC oxidoreductase [Algibacillus agarilyticus]|uniref:GMC oxidoreductase n=1 Tax=Algibacillus agarilyticus TaxID=2234133 RepID=UPI000DD0C3B9|nr:GMC family oxidoreductase [Algibacillus agarilyticus]
MKTNYEAIVIGSGISGGYAAMELCKKGYKTLMLERGRMVQHGDYPTAMLDKWDLPNQGEVSLAEKENHYEKQNRLSWWVKEDVKPFINRDDEYPYLEDERFDWIRGHHVGGRSVMWGRHCPRWSEHDFEANKRDGVAIDWPIRYNDIEPWYEYVETFVGVAGQAEGLKQAPDGNFIAPFPLNAVEQKFREAVKEKYPNRVVTPCRTANLSEYNPDVHKGLRGQCQARNRCKRGCPFGAYFSTQSATLPVAQETGNLTLKSDCIVMEIIYDAKLKKATGVKVKDANTGEIVVYTANIIFCNASTVGTAAILLNSRSEAFPNGLGNTSGELGHNMMDHHYGMGASGLIDGFDDEYYLGRKPKGFFIPPFTNIDEQTKQSDYIRNFSYQGGASRVKNAPKGVIGAALKDEIFKPGAWRINLHCFGEILPHHDNRMYLNFSKRDKHGLPLITFDAKLRENEYKIRKDGVKSAIEMLEAAGCTDIKSSDRETAIGACIHEMGTARMGHDPKTSVLNKWNQMHDVPNVFVTDGACMTSAGTQNPSITYMALTARAVDYADKQVKQGKL